MRDYHQLEVWQRAMTYAVQIYELSASLPDDERYNLVAQMRRAATSVALNIAEGSGCETDAEFAHFLRYGYRSLKETITCLELCQRLYSSRPIHQVAVLIDEGEQIARMINALIERLKPRKRRSQR